jgi:hypothetical protein
VLVCSVVDLSRRISAPVSGRVRNVAAGAILAALGIGWCVMRFAETDYFFKPHNYRAAAAVIGDGLRPGDMVYVPENFTFWGVARYLKGADWGSPLAVQDAAAPDNSERWKSLLAKLGPEWRNRLNLEPRGRTIDVGGSPLVVGWSRPAEIDRAQRVWLVTHESDEFGKVAPFLGGFTEVTQKDFQNITVHLLERGGPARSETQ